MAHHGPDPMEQLGGLRDKLEQLGATGRHPEGRLTDDDEGEIRIAIGSRDGAVVIDFGKPVHWIGFTPKQAMKIAEDLVKHARAISDEPLVFRIERG